MAGAVPPAELTPEYWLHPHAAVVASPIAGSGLRARRPIAVGDTAVRFTVAPTSVGDVRHVNHSCDPTLWWDDEITLVARRDITTGDELTVDYATGPIPSDFVLMCHCETYRCRQLIAGDDWQIPQLQQRYAGHWAPSRQRLIDAAL
jgi:uncharacterized protein